GWIAGAVWIVQPAVAQEKGKSPEEAELEELERSAQKSALARPGATPAPSLAGRIIQSLNPDISSILTVTGSYFNDRGLGGNANFVPQGESDPKGSGIGMQELEVAFQAAVDPYF